MINYAEARSAATDDAQVLAERIKSGVGIEPGSADELVPFKALANALLAAIGDYLMANSDEDGLELLFEVYGRQPDDLRSWPVSILAGLRSQEISAVEFFKICNRSVDIAVRFIESESPLA